MTIDSLFAPFAEPGKPGASILVMQGDSIAIQKAYGLADVAAGIPATPESNFRLASLSKQFVATAILLLVGDGKLTLETPLTDILPAFPAYGRAIRVRHLLSHTSGVWDYEDFVPDTQTYQVRDADVLKLLTTRTESTYFAPGSRYRYSNSGYVLLGQIVEHASAMRLADFLLERVFRPASLTATIAFEDGVSTVERRAFGHTVIDDSVTRTDQSNTSATLGDGGVYSSTSDMARWIRALRHHTVLDSATFARQTTPFVLADGTASEYAFGWFVDVFRGHRRLRHHGETRGFTNSIQLFPDDGLSIVVLTNRTDSAPWDIVETIATSIFTPGDR
ncbi:MAG: Penicillin-binding protein 4* [Gemmatimonadaceae bacterium]|nr:Penicillin-binding protein 4* [Gemmatimonadaceae bacterium]